MGQVSAASAAPSNQRDFKRGKRTKGRKALQALGELEIDQFQQVLQVDAFQKNPFGALEQHLKNSLKRQWEPKDTRKLKLKQRSSMAGKKQQLQAQNPTGVIKKSLK